ncbi:MAG: putative lipid II flippase FtsW [Acidimicrobiales bacterium]|nr:putative lipid II flippase FtsW [Acidimicrobiales bacterium]
MTETRRRNTDTRRRVEKRHPQRSIRTPTGPRVVRERRRPEPVPTRRRGVNSRKSVQAAALILVGIVISLSTLGLTMVLSASSVTSLAATGSPWGEFRSQSIWLGLGLAVMIVISFLDYQRLRILTIPGLGISMVMLLLVLVPSLGIEVNGAQRWLRLGPLQFQPSEIAKFALVLYGAHVLSLQKDIDLRRSVRPLVAVLITYGTLILLQPNLGTTIIVFAIGLMIMFSAGVKLWVLAGLGGISVAGAGILAFFAEYRRARLLAFMDPWASPLQEGYQTIQSLVSVANGGVTGVGIGASRGKFGFLPEAHNDFIFAVMAEEFGLVGASVVVLAYAIFGLAALSIARRADRFGGLLVVGITTWVLVQAFINVGAVLGVMPITGVPLPFMSAGGTSLVSTLGGVGVILSVARRTK